MATKIKHVFGNVLRIQVPLTIKIRTIVDGQVVETEQEFYPNTNMPTTIALKKKDGMRISFTATVDGNVAIMEDVGSLSIGVYQVEVFAFDEEENPYRYMARSVVEIVDATADAGIEAGVEFDAETHTLEGAVFISYGGGGGGQVQSDWAVEDPRSSAYIKNKPTIPVVPTNVSAFTNDAGYLTQHQDISEKEDKTAIVATSTASGVLTTEVGKYYRIDVAVDTLAITLPAMTDNTTVRTVVIYLTGGTTPAVTITAADSKNVYYQDGFEIEAGSTYEVNALFNGAAWIVASVKINVE